MVDDAELRRRLHLLKERLAEGKVVIAEHLEAEFRESLGRVQYGIDGEIDLSTVDGRIRSMAMAIAMMQHRNEMKSAASLVDIQNAYYDRITPMFEGVYELMVRHKENPQSISWVLSQDEYYIEQNYRLIEPFLAELTDFWQAMADPVRYHLQDLNALKGVFGGDLFPSYERNIASSTGLYLDTIILTDPFMNTRDLFSRWPKKEAVRMFLKHGLQLMNYRQLVLADTELPLVVILPFESALDESYRDALFSAAGPKAVVHANKIFGTTFAAVDELQDFLSRLDTPSEVIKHYVDSSWMLFDSDWEEEPEAQLKKAIQENVALAGHRAGDVVFNQCFGRMSQATDITWKSISLGGTPLIDAPTSWQYYNWSLEYDAQHDRLSDMPLHLSRGMQRLAETEMQWLGNIPVNALIEIRKQGALDEIRQMLSQGVEEVITVNPDNFFRSADKIYDNLEAAFAEHQKKIGELRAKKWKFIGSDIGSWVVAGSIEVTAVLLGSPAWGLVSAAISQVTDAPKLKDIPNKIRQLRGENDTLVKSAAGLLFQHKN